MLKIQNLAFCYPQGKEVLKGVSLEIRRGDKTAIIGPNGSGKTTLFLLCCGILKQESGSVSLCGKDIVYRQFDSRISYLFQSADDQLFSSSIYDDVAFGPLNMGLNKKEIDERVVNALERVGYRESSDRAPFHLSGGEKRLAAIATLLSMSPEVLLFDEPTANLDSRNRRKVIQLIQAMEETLVISSHDLEFLLETCSRVILLDDGKVVADGPIREILADRELMNWHGLEIPHSLEPHEIGHHGRTKALKY